MSSITSQSKWVPLYILASSVLIVTLLGVLIFKNPAENNKYQQSQGPSADGSLRDARKITEELEKQRELQAAMTERQRVEAEQRAATMEAQRKKDEEEALLNAAKTRMAALSSQIERLQESLDQTQSASSELKTNVENFMLNHKMATTALVAGLGGAGVAFDSRNKFSDDAKALGTLGAVAAGLWIFSDRDNLQEVVHVGSELTKASNTQSQYEKQITSLRGQIKTKETEKSSLAMSVTCPTCNKSFLLVREHWHATFSCPHCNASLKLTNPPN